MDSSLSPCPLKGEELLVLSQSVSPSDLRTVLSLDSDALLRSWKHIQSLHADQQLAESEYLRSISSSFSRLHPELLELQPRWLHPDVRFLLQVQEEGVEVPDLGMEAMRKRLVLCGEREGQALLMDRPAPRVYHVRWFSEEFCTLLLEELHNFDAQRLSLRERPNSLNRRGVLLKDLGMDDFFAEFCRRCVAPVAAVLFPDYGGTSLDDHYTFTVQYGEEEEAQRGLDLHVDDSEVTLNFCLGESFEGGDLVFRGHGDKEYEFEEENCVKQEQGVGVLHAGVHRHEAQPLVRGHRVNLIMWCRNTQLRINNIRELWEFLHTPSPVDERSPGSGSGGGFAATDAASQQCPHLSSSPTDQELLTVARRVRGDPQRMRAFFRLGVEEQREALQTMQEELQQDADEAAEHFRRVQARYKPLHPDVYTFSMDIVAEPLRSLVQHREHMEEATTRDAIEEVVPGVFRFKVFTEEFCSKLLEELDHFERSGLVVRRPNSMNNYGIVLTEMGLQDLVSDFMEQCIRPIAAVLFPSYGGSTLDHHHSFTVQYKLGGDRNLGFHVDDSDVTMNLCLGKRFRGGDLFFRGLMDQPDTHSQYEEVSHEPQCALLHAGLHRHGAKDLLEGLRTNLIIWCRSTEHRVQKLRTMWEEYQEQKRSKRAAWLANKGQVDHHD